MIQFEDEGLIGQQAEPTAEFGLPTQVMDRFSWHFVHKRVGKFIGETVSLPVRGIGGFRGLARRLRGAGGVPGVGAFGGLADGVRDENENFAA